MNEEITKKLKAMEVEIIEEKGEFSLFVWWHREDAKDKIDLVVSAPWLEADKRSGLEYLARKVQLKLDRDELLSLSRIVLLDKGDPVLEDVQKKHDIKQGKAKKGKERVENTYFSDIQVAEGYISTSSANPVQVFKLSQ